MPRCVPLTSACRRTRTSAHACGFRRQHAPDLQGTRSDLPRGAPLLPMRGFLLGRAAMRYFATAIPRSSCSTSGQGSRAQASPSSSARPISSAVSPISIRSSVYDVMSWPLPRK